MRTHSECINPTKMAMAALKVSTRKLTPSRRRSQLSGAELEHVLTTNLTSDSKSCVRISWEVVRQMKLPEGVYPMSRFVTLYFETLFSHDPQTQKLFPDLPLQSEYIASLLSVVVNLDNSPSDIVEKKKEKYKSLVRELDYSIQTHILAGRALLRTLQICLDDSDFDTEVREAWSTEYADLAYFACRSSERSQVTKESIAELVVYLDITNQKFITLIYEGEEHAPTAPKSTIKANRMGSLRKAIGAKKSLIGSVSESSLPRGSPELTKSLSSKASNKLTPGNSRTLRRASGTNVLSTQPSKGNKLRRASESVSLSS